MQKELTNAEETKLIIIENFIEWFSSDENERNEMKALALTYVQEDHVNELEDIL